MVNIDKLQEMNKWWAKGSQFYLDDADIMKYQHVIKMHRKDLVPFLKPGKILIMKGPRRAGKTITIKLAIMKLLSQGKVNQDDIFYFSFDEAITQREMDSVIRNFLSKPHSGTTYVFLDEIQSVRRWAEVMLGLANSGVLSNTAVAVTGSIAHFFGAETLPGRGTEGNIFYLRTASFRAFVLSLLEAMKEWNTLNQIGRRMGYNFTPDEVSALHDAVLKQGNGLENGIDRLHECASVLERYYIPLSKMFDLYTLSGGYPLSIGSIISGTPQQSAVYEEIYNYIKNDAATITSAVSGDPLKAAQAVSGMLGYVGKKVSYSKIAKLMSMNKATLIDYYNRLENSFVFLNIKGLKQGDGGLKESEVKKFYFSDVFMHYSAGAAQTGKSGEAYAKELVNSSNMGIVIEEIVAGHLIRVKESDPMRLYGTYLKFYDGTREVDFVYRTESNKNMGIEVKYQNSASLQDVKVPSGIDEYVLLTKSSDIVRRGNHVLIPTCIFLAVLESSDKNL